MDSPTSDQKKLGSVVSFHNVTYTVKVKPPGASPCSAAEDKEILKNLSGIFKPGQMTAILGATGSGKTSLLDVLARRKNPAGLKGDILIDGKQQTSNFKCRSGYVVQDDVVMGTLTVRENFAFSANLRLPKSVTAEEKKQRVTDIINELGLSHVADSKVGNEFIRGISGGERKRTNIGMELIISPSVLFLDEPTTGLDASTANAVMLLLHRLARKGRTIIFSIHQPRYSIFKLFDHLVLLSRGHMVYQGPTADALTYFSSIGYECEAHNNPPDFFLDVINGDSTAVEKITAANGEAGSLPLMSDGGDEVAVSIKDEASSNGDDTLARELAEKYKRSTWSQSLQREVQVIEEQNKNGEVSYSKEDDLPYGGYNTSFFTQLYYVAARTILNIVRNPLVTVVQVFVMIVFAVLVGLIYLDVEDTIIPGLQNRTGAFFFIVMNQVFGNLSALELFLRERVIFIHENSNGFYRVSPYFLAKVFCDLIPLRIVPISFFAVITYFMIGLQAEVDKFFIYMLTLVLTTLTAASLGFLFSGLVRTFAIANLLIALSYVFMMVFGGFLVSLDSIVDWLSWIKYVSIFRYSMNTLYINELKDLELCVSFTKNGTGIGCDPDAGKKFLDQMNVAYDTNWDLWQNIVALLGMTTVLLSLTYISLRRINKYK